MSMGTRVSLLLYVCGYVHLIIYTSVYIFGVTTSDQRFYSTPEFENISPFHIINWWVHRSCV